jgi:hypothetical protein
VAIPRKIAHAMLIVPLVAGESVVGSISGLEKSAD